MSACSGEQLNCKTDVNSCFEWNTESLYNNTYKKSKTFVLDEKIPILASVAHDSSSFLIQTVKVAIETWLIDDSICINNHSLLKKDMQHITFSCHTAPGMFFFRPKGRNQKA